MTRTSVPLPGLHRPLRRLPMARSTRAYAFALERIPIPPGGWVLDLGAGQGWGTAFLARRLPGSRVVGVDVRRDCRAPEAGSIPLVQGRAPELPFRPGTFDAAFLVMTFHCLPEPAATLGALARLLRPGGLLILADVDGAHPLARPFEWVEHLAVSPWTRAYRAEELRSMLLEAGFAHVEVHRRPGRRRSFLVWWIARR